MQAVADQAAKVLQSISDLSQRQLEAQQALEKAVQSQLYAIKVAAQQNIISLPQALELWKRARRDRAVATKAATLANIPCNSHPTNDNQFSVNRQLMDSNGCVVRTVTACTPHQPHSLAVDVHQGSAP
jgi:hypothetical protein